MASKMKRSHRVLSNPVSIESSSNIPTQSEQDNSNSDEEMWDTTPLYLDYNSDNNSENESDTQIIYESDIHDSDSAINKPCAIVIVSEDDIETTLYCTICNLSFDNKLEVDNHFKEPIHNTCRKCQLCYKIMDENAYECHMTLHKEIYKQLKEKNKVQCKICKKFVTRTYMKFHMTKHEPNKSDREITCTICKKSVYINYFNIHMKKMHLPAPKNRISNEEKEICPICDRSVNKNIMEEHIATHSNNCTAKLKTRICDICGKVFPNRSSFYTHQLTHTGDLKFKCEFCPYRGLHLGLLKVHVRTHTKDYLYECSICKKRFITKSNLSAHEIRHSPPKFNCSTCNKTFYTQNKLDKHIHVTHLGKKDFKCDLCGKLFGYSGGLNAHEKKVHKRLPITNVGRLPSYLKLKESTQHF